VIKHQTTIPYNPQHNGVAERMNKTLKYGSFHDVFKNVKLMFWAGAVLCAVYVKNMCPYHALGNKIPYEMWYGRIPSVRHLRVFGSTYYALIPKEQRNKLDARSHKCIFLGYTNTTKAYRLYDEVNKNDMTVEWQLDHLESPFESPPREEVPTTSSKPEVHLDDVIERIERPNLDENSIPSQSTEQLGPS
jgi:hypothetical protein